MSLGRPAAAGGPEREDAPELRPLSLEDAETVASLERKIFSDPWSLPAVEQVICRAGKGEASLSYGAWGAWADGRLVGYFFSMAVAGEGELHRIAVDEGARRRGTGSALMARFCQWLWENHCGAAFLEVREGNLPAVSLYEKFGFVRCGRRKGYYQEPAEDALLFRYQ